MGNKDIEPPQELVYEDDMLPFEKWFPDDVNEKIDTNEIEMFLSDVYNAIASNGTVNEKINVLTYFETIILNSQVANRLINSAFITIIMKMLKTVKSPNLKARLCSIIGQLIRHSTVINNDLAECKICELLSEVAEEKSDKVKRKTLGALGEYLFYAAT